MQKNNKISQALFKTLALLLAVSFVFSACKDDDGSDEVVLNAFGPSPVALGGKVTFVGQNLNQVTAIEFPGYTVEKGSFVLATSTQIEVTATTDTTKAQEGFVTLVTSSGNITSKTKIGYRQTCLLESFSPAKVKAGDKLTLSGQYMSSVLYVTLPSGVVVDREAFVSADNATIVVTVPAEAQSGKISISDGEEEIYAASDLEVTLPTFTSFSKTTDVFPGKDEITINGNDLDLVTSLTFENGVELKNFKAEAKTLKFTYPADAKGAITMNVASGLSIKAGSVALVGPQFTYFGYNGKDESVFDPAVVYKLGSSLTFTGENLNLVKSMSFGNGTTEELTVSSDGKTLQVKIPADATTTNQDQSGPLPTDEAHSWGRIYPGWQQGFIISATSTNGDKSFVGYAYAEWGSGFWGNMGLNDQKDGFDAWPGTSEANDYIKSITFEDKDVTDEYKTTGKVKVPLRVVNSCPMTITLTNGASKDVDCATDEARAAVDFPIVSEFPAEEVAGHLIEVKGFNFTTETKFEFVNAKGSTAVTAQGFNNANSYYITLPQSLSGTYTLKVSNGDKSSNLESVSVAGSMAVLFEGSHPLDWSKEVGGWDLTGVSKLQVTVKGNYSGWLGFMFQTKEGKNLWKQKDFEPEDGTEFTLEITGADIPKDSDWYVCGGTSGACNIIKIVAVY